MPRFLAPARPKLPRPGNDVLTWSQQNAYGTSFPSATKAVQSAGWYFSADQAFDMTVAYQLNPDTNYLTALLANMNLRGRLQSCQCQLHQPALVGSASAASSANGN